MRGRWKEKVWVGIWMPSHDWWNGSWVHSSRVNGSELHIEVCQRFCILRWLFQPLNLFLILWMRIQGKQMFYIFSGGELKPQIFRFHFTYILSSWFHCGSQLNRPSPTASLFSVSNFQLAATNFLCFFLLRCWCCCCFSFISCKPSLTNLKCLQA